MRTEANPQHGIIHSTTYYVPLKIIKKLKQEREKNLKKVIERPQSLMDEN